MALAIRFRSAVALLGGFPVLAGVDLDVGEGDVVLLQGANGTGKTSLLRACAGLLPIVSGTAQVLGHDLLTDRRGVRRDIGLLGHATALYDDLSVEDNVRFAVRAAGASRSTVGPALDRLGLSGRLCRVAVSRLSAGQRRRTALAVLVARDPRLWLLDEPHAGLDAEHRDLLDELVRDATGRGATVLMASHEHDRAVALAGRIVIMAGGQVSAPASPSADVPPPVPGDGGPTAGARPGPGPSAPSPPSPPAPVAPTPPSSPASRSSGRLEQVHVA
ncbi:MAG TPA: heme ABC exporter ATP-binding protein CcmA [Acidimicrobiales bacterium]|jgi:heme ABC exporter ATP-binding subunit CcmA